MYWKVGRFADAEAELAKALELDPNFPEAKFYLAHTYLTDQKAQQSIPLLQSVVAQDPGNARAMRDLGKALNQTGHPQEAERELEESLRVDPSNAEAHYQLAQIYRQLNQPAKAEQELESTKNLLAEKRSKEESVLAAAGKRGDATQQLGLSPQKDTPAAPDGTH